LVETQEQRLQVEVTERGIDVPALCAWAADPEAGAVLSFVGTVRASKEGRRVLRIDYEAYVSMAARQLGCIGAEMLSQWPTRRVALLHRVGRLAVGEASIAIVVSSPHRDAGFAALRHGIESVKRRVPIWKKEYFEDGAVWVQERP